MKHTATRILASVVTFAFVLLATGTAGPIEGQPYFEFLKGNWTGTGELSDQNGETIAITEDWEGKVEEDGSFSMRGNRDWNGESQEFRWVYLYNEATELFEVEYWHTGMDNPILMEASVTDTWARLKTGMGDSGGELLIENTIEDGKLIGKVTLTNGQGQTTLGGVITHERKAAP